MAIILLVCIAATAASAASVNDDGMYSDWQQELIDRTELNKLQEVYPAKRSNYGNSYLSPCAAAASASMGYAPAAASSIPVYASAATPHSYSHAAYQTVPTHQGYASSHYANPYYRTEDELENDQGILGFSDGNHVAPNHMPMARYSYDAPQIISSNMGTGQAAVSGPVVGVFSNAKVGGCSVPLLVSCSPSIAHGRLVKSQPYYASGGSPNQGYLYRGVDDQNHHEEAPMHQEMAVQSSSEHSTNPKLISDKHQ